jgi:hypothetical protein
VSRLESVFGVLILCACQPRSEPARRVVFDFEVDEEWTVEHGDVSASPSFRRAPVHRHGAGFLGTAETADGKRDIEQRGRLRSPEFVIDHDYLVLRAGLSGVGKGCSVSLSAALDDERLHEIVPKEGRMLTYIWDARPVRGDAVVLRLVDKDKKEACSVHIDYVRLVDE